MVIEYFLDWIANAPVTKRVEVAGAMVRAYLNPEIDPEEREDIEAALTVLLDDPSSTVRAKLASAFGARGGAPRHIILALASDVMDVSVIVLSRSSVLHDCELVQFLKSGEIEKQIAISCRPWLSGSVLTALCEHACEEACLGVLANPVADFSTDNLHQIADRFGENAEVRNVLLERPDLAAETRLLLINKLGTTLSSFVSGNQWIKTERAELASSEACDKAAIAFSATVSDEDVGRIVRSLINDGKMTVAFLLRALCMGNIALVAHALSQLGTVRLSKVETILNKDRKSAFKAVYDRAGLPASAFNIFSSAITIWRELLSSGSQINQQRMPFLVTRKVLETYTGQNDKVVDDLLLLLRRLSADAARDCAKSKADEISRRAPEAVQQLAQLVKQSEALQSKAALELEQAGEVEELVSEPEPVLKIEAAQFEELIEPVAEVETELPEAVDEVRMDAISDELFALKAAMSARIDAIDAARRLPPPIEISGPTDPLALDVIDYVEIPDQEFDATGALFYPAEAKAA